MSGQAKHFYAFGPFCFDSEKRVLVRDGKAVALAPKAAETLLVLVENAGHLVSKDDLMKRVWPDAFVEEANLPKNILALRKILGEWDSDQDYIETVPKRGYRFVAAVEEVTHAEGAPQPSTFPSASLLGRKVSHYRVLEVIGGGGMGLVYKAEDLKLGRRVALKFLPEELATDSLALQRFEREARTASSLNHPNICTIFEIEEHENQPFIVMELLEGEILRELIPKKTAQSGGQPSHLSLEKLLDIAIQVMKGLNAAHQKGVIHRDIKPANIFLTAHGQAKILDFGLAKLAAAASGVAGEPAEDHAHAAAEHTSGRTPFEHSLTRTGAAMGTAGYMSPEQVRGEKLDARTDLFSFGLVLYEMATGQRAFCGDTAPVLHDAILNHTPVPVHDLNSTLPPRLQQIIEKAIEKDREKRYQSASEMRDDLVAVAENSSVQSLRDLKWNRARQFVTGSSAAFVVLLCLAAALLITRRQPVRPQLKQTQLTENSSENEVENGAISPDGKYLAYTDLRGMHLKLLETGETRTIQEPEELKRAQLDWAPFPLSSTKFLANIGILGQPASAWVVSVMGGAPKKLHDNASLPSASPDGSMIAFVTGLAANGFREIWLMDSNGEHARKIVSS